MKRLADTLEVSRSRLCERLAEAARTRPARYAKAEDHLLLPMIREIVDERLTYGYRRVCAVLNRQLAEAGRPKVNHKRVYRIMRAHGLLLARHTGLRPSRPHDGKVITLKSNLRWSSDCFEIPCQSGEAVRVAFVLDCCDREAIGFVASTGGVNGEMIRDLMLEAVEKRFGLPGRSIRWSGSATTAPASRPGRRSPSPPNMV